MGDDAPHHGGPPLRQETERDPWLLRGWSEPSHDGDERLERRRARLVAQPTGAPRRHGRAYRWHARHPWAGGARRRARAPLGPMARDGGRRRWVRDSPPVRDRSRRPRARFRVSRQPCRPVDIWGRGKTGSFTCKPFYGRPSPWTGGLRKTGVYVRNVETFDLSETNAGGSGWRLEERTNAAHRVTRRGLFARSWTSGRGRSSIASRLR